MRKLDWRRRLVKYIEECRGKEFSFGTIDCCTFCADGVMVMTDIDYMKEFRGKYSTKQEAIDALKKIGNGSLYHTMRKKFGNARRIARAGDIAFMVGEDGPTLGLCVGDKSIFIGEDRGSSLVEIQSMGLRFFKVD